MYKHVRIKKEQENDRWIAWRIMQRKEMADRNAWNGIIGISVEWGLYKYILSLLWKLYIKI